ncbi:MAG: sigma 54-interacting transcriptional regulator, partial [Carboxydocellales bacterium]
MVWQNLTKQPALSLLPGLSLDQALNELIQNKMLAAPVVADGQFIGILTLLDILSKTSKANRLHLTVQEVLIANPPRLTAGGELPAVPKGDLPFYPVVAENGFFLGIVTTADLLRYLQNNLALVRNRNQTILDSIHNGILVINQFGEIILSNEAGGRLLGVEPEQILGRSVHELFPTSGLPKVINTGQAESGRKIIVNGRMLVSNRSPLRNAGQVVGAVAVFQDITELDQISSELETVQTLNRELNAIIESSYDGIMVTDSKGIGLRINQALSRLTGLDEGHYVGKSIEDLFKSGIFHYEPITIAALRAGRRVTSVQKINTGKEVVVTGNPIFDAEGKVTHIVTNVRDITELAQLQGQLRESQMRSARYQTELNQVLIERMQQDHVVAKSPIMLKALDLALRVARTDSSVLITGESGSGKEVIARIIHNNSNRREQGSFIKINCGAIPENLLESELFGYETGAFTGARKEGKVGLFEAADQGTILLDEIGEIPVNLQVKLLRVLQEQELYRIGGTKPIKLDIRVIAATNRNLMELIRDGRFREDLFYRLNVVPINVPPLRERRSDILPLALNFLAKHNHRTGGNKQIEVTALNLLESYSWPGNVRELENVVERLMVLSNDELICQSLVENQLFKEQGRQPLPININRLIPLRVAQE